MRPIFFSLLTIFLLQSCARRGNPTGGPKDENAPIIIQTFPKFNTTEFKNKEIKIYFDEFVKLKDLRKQLVVSPPLKYPIEVLPQGMATKKIAIKIKDTLKNNTTYVLNFGNSIEDNNEGNVLTDFKYVFSTGKQIDTLQLKGTIKDAFQSKTDDYVSVLLYKANRFNDSIVFKEKPDYVANSLDSTVFNFTNLKGGKYRIIALKESNTDYIYQPKDEKIAFIDSVIQIPTNKNIVLNLFKKEPNFKLKKITELAKGHLLFGYEGNADKVVIQPIKIDSIPFDKITNFKSYQYKEKNADSIHYFYVYKKMDSIKFRILKDTIQQEMLARIKNKKLDSLILSSSVKGVLHPFDTLTITSTVPLDSIHENQFQLMESDSIPVKVSLRKKLFNQLQVLFDRKPKTRYNLLVLPGAVHSVFNQTNDTVKYGIQTKKDAYYGSITLKINTKKLPLIVTLLDAKNKVVRTNYLKENTEVVFEKLVPGEYHIRVIYDRNKNHKWDTGDFMKHLQPEPVFYMDKTINLKENWFLNETININ